LSVPLETFIVDSYPSIGGDLLLRLGTIMSMVGRNVLGLELVGD